MPLDWLRDDAIHPLIKNINDSDPMGPEERRDTDRLQGVQASANSLVQLIEQADKGQPPYELTGDAAERSFQRRAHLCDVFEASGRQWQKVAETARTLLIGFYRDIDLIALRCEAVIAAGGVAALPTALTELAAYIGKHGAALSRPAILPSPVDGELAASDPIAAQAEAERLERVAQRRQSRNFTTALDGLTSRLQETLRLLPLGDDKSAPVLLGDLQLISAPNLSETERTHITTMLARVPTANQQLLGSCLTELNLAASRLAEALAGIPHDTSSDKIGQPLIDFISTIAADIRRYFGQTTPLSVAEPITPAAEQVVGKPTRQPDAGNPAGTIAVPNTGQAITGPITSRSQALQALAAVATYFEQNEPSGFIGYSARELFRRAQLPFPSLLAEMMSNETERQALLVRLGQKLS